MLVPFKGGRFSEQEERFTRTLAETGDVTYAGYVAGYKARPSAIVAKSRDPAVVAAVESIRADDFMVAVGLSGKALIDALQPDANPRIRADVAKWVQDRWETRLAGANPGAQKEDHELTLDELKDKQKRLRLEIDALAIDVTPIELVEGDQLVDDEAEPGLFD